jgi:hypothetical protein
MVIGKEMAEEILSAIHIAQSETGEFYDLEKKILKFFPEIVDERLAMQMAVEKEGKRQHEARRQLIIGYNLQVPFKTVESTTKWFIENYDYIRSQYSDEISFCGDMWQYLPKRDLKEVIDSLRATQGRTDFLSKRIRESKDADLWHYLIQFLEHATYLERCKKHHYLP